MTLDTLSLIQQDFDLPDAAAGMSEDQLIGLLAQEIDYQLAHRREWMMSLLYRLDVRQDLVEAALHPDAPEPANFGLARLLYQRQQQRAYTKATIKSPDIDEESLRW